MKRLLLLRHGKSDWAAAGGRDHDRPLAPRGERAARLVGRFLNRVDLAPDAILSSSALRARTTAELAAEAGGWDCGLEITRKLYDASPASVLAEIRRQGDGHQTLLVAGHEPTTSELTAALIGGGRLRVVTAALVAIEIEVQTWAEVDAGLGSLVWFLPPKLLEAAGFKAPSASKAKGV